MAGMEGIIRPFQTPTVTPTRIYTPGGASTPPVHFSVGLRGGQKTFSFTGSSSLSSYMMQVHKESSSDNFDMTTGKPK